MDKVIAAKPNEKENGWNESFDRFEPEGRGPEKPIYILNARQLEFVSHIKHMMATQKDN